MGLCVSIKSYEEERDRGFAQEARISILQRTVDELETHLQLLERSEQEFSAALGAERGRRSEDRTRVARTLEHKHDELQIEREQRKQLAQKAVVEKIELRQKFSAEIMNKTTLIESTKREMQRHIEQMSARFEAELRACQEAGADASFHLENEIQSNGELRVQLRGAQDNVIVLERAVESLSIEVGKYKAQSDQRERRRPPSIASMTSEDEAFGWVEDDHEQAVAAAALGATATENQLLEPDSSNKDGEHAANNSFVEESSDEPEVLSPRLLDRIDSLVAISGNPIGALAPTDYDHSVQEITTELGHGTIQNESKLTFQENSGEENLQSVIDADADHGINTGEREATDRLSTPTAPPYARDTGNAAPETILDPQQFQTLPRDMHAATISSSPGTPAPIMTREAIWTSPTNAVSAAESTAFNNGLESSASSMSSILQRPSPQQESTQTSSPVFTSPIMTGEAIWTSPTNAVPAAESTAFNNGLESSASSMSSILQRPSPQQESTQTSSPVFTSPIMTGEAIWTSPTNAVPAAESTTFNNGLESSASSMPSILQSPLPQQELLQVEM